MLTDYSYKTICFALHQPWEIQSSNCRSSSQETLSPQPCSTCETTSHPWQSKCNLLLRKKLYIFQDVLWLPKIDPSILLSTWIELSVKNEILFSCSFTKAFQQNRLWVSPGKENDQKHNSIKKSHLSSFTNFLVDFLQNAQNLLSHLRGRNVPNSIVRQSSWVGLHTLRTQMS